MEWENEKAYQGRKKRWDNVMPSSAPELLDEGKISAFRDWLCAQSGLRISRRIATSEYYEFDDEAGAAADLCQRSEAFMLTLTPKVVRGWGGEWQVYEPIRELSFEPTKVWSAICVRDDPDSKRDPIFFKLMRLDDRGLPPRAITPRLVSADVIYLR